MSMKWDAKGYTQNFKFVHQYGEEVLNLLEIKEGMRVLDLGCGNGALTKKLALLGAEIIGMDASEDMLEVARVNYPELTFIQGDATSFTLDKPVDVIFSNAVFHWIENQEALLENVANALNVSGYLVCEFGGYGNGETIHSSLAKAFEKRGLKYKRNFYFPTIGEYSPILEKYNLKVTYATLFERKTALVGEDGMMDWIKMFVTQPFQTIESELAEEIRKEAVQDLRPKLYEDGVWYADYVRIRIKAQKIEGFRDSGSEV